MFLTAQNLFYYLRDTGLATADDVVGGDFAVVEVGRRNRNFLVLRPRAGSLFVKQIPALAPETISSFRREAACAQLAHDAGAHAALPCVTPTLRRYDPGRHVLVYDAFEGGETLNELVQRTGALPAGMAGRLARTLAACHLEGARPGALAAVAPALPGETPWVFVIGEKAETLMPTMSGGSRQVVDAIRATPELLYGLAALGAGWRRVGLMHGDLKWDNLLVIGPADGERELRVIDWELADLGDPLWDVAGMLSSFLQYWIVNVPAQHAADPARALAGDWAVPLGAARALAGEFWHAYGSAVRAEIPLSPELARLAGRLTGARLVLLAFELLQAAPAMTPHAALALQLARYLLADPRRGMADLLGIGVDAPAAVAPLAAGAAAPWKLGTLNAGIA
jgi:hypothetical protein